MITVTLHPAYQWACPECGHVQYASLVPVELTRRERETLRRRLDDPYGHAIDDTVHFTAPPDTVTCGVCKTEYRTETEEP